MICLFKIVIVNCYVKLPEGNRQKKLKIGELDCGLVWPCMPCHGNLYNGYINLYEKRIHDHPPKWLHNPPFHLGTYSVRQQKPRIINADWARGPAHWWTGIAKSKGRTVLNITYLYCKLWRWMVPFTEFSEKRPSTSPILLKIPTSTQQTPHVCWWNSHDSPCLLLNSRFCSKSSRNSK